MRHGIVSLLPKRTTIMEAAMKKQLERIFPDRDIDWTFVLGELDKRGMTIAHKCYVTEPRMQKALYELCDHCGEASVQYVYEGTVICQACRWYSINGGKQIDPERKA